MNKLGILAYLAAGVLALVTMILKQRRHERQQWNGGNCPDCGSRWESFDTDSSGARGYVCKGGHRT
jgi:hypothetical protein